MKKDFQINDIEALRGLLYSCMEGDSEAIMLFQEIFGEDIYNFPVKVRGSEIDKRLSEKNENYASRLAKLDEIEVKILNIEKQLRTLRQQGHENNENTNPQFFKNVYGRDYNDRISIRSLRPEGNIQYPILG